MTSEREDEEWKGKLPGEIGKQEARRVFGSLPAMTGEYLWRATRARVRTRLCTCACVETHPSKRKSVYKQ